MEKKIKFIFHSRKVGHASSSTYSHSNGYKLDYRLNTCLNNYITKHYTYLGLRSDGAKKYKSAAGNIYALEGNHWDVTYYWFYLDESSSDDY